MHPSLPAALQRLRLLALGLCLGLALDLTGSAAFISGLINVDIDPQYPPTIFTGAAAIGDNGDFWNTVPVFSLSPIVLNTADGLLSDVTLEQPIFQSGNIRYGAGGYHGGFSPMTLGPYGALMGDGMSASNVAPTVVRLHGLTASAEYELFAYAYSNFTGSGTRISAGGASGTVVYSEGLTELVLGQSYTRLAAVRADASGSLGITIERFVGPLNGNLAGFQIRPIPEPATLGFGVALSWCLIAGRWRRR